MKIFLSSIDSIIDFDECFGTIGSGMRDTMNVPAVVANEVIKGTFIVIYVLFGSGESTHPKTISYSFSYEYIDITGLVLGRSW